MQDFYKNLALRAPGIFVRALVRTDTTFDILSKLILAVFVGSSNPVIDFALGLWNEWTGAEVTLNGVPLWWSLILLGIIFLHGLFRYAYQDKQKVELERDALKEKLKAYEGRDAPEVVAEAHYEGPNGKMAFSHGGSDRANLHDLVLFGSGGWDDPAATIEVEDAREIYLVELNYEVRSTNTHSLYQPEKTIRTETNLQVLDEEGNEIRYPTVYAGMGTVAEDGSWRYTVSGRTTLSGLPKGVYRLNVYDYTNARGVRAYYNTHLVVTKLGNAAASS